jgi:hypothetical protein
MKKMIIVAGRLFSLFIMLVIWVATVYIINEVKKGKTFEIRRVPGLDAIDEALGRCVETGRPVLATPSWRPLGSYALPMMAGIAMVRHTCLRAAELDLPIIMPVGSADTYPLILKNYEQACIEAGKPEIYDPDNVVYMSGQQWAFSTGMFQLMMDNNVGACIMIGRWSAETLSVTTVGNRIGAFQIGGTGQFSNTSFFAITADYTLIGDELYAAAAYVSDDPEIKSFLNAQDVAKLIAAAIIIAGAVLGSLGIDFVSQLIAL